MLETATPPIESTNPEVVKLQAENALLHKALEDHQAKLAGLGEAAQKIALHEQKIAAYQDFARAQLKAKHESAPEWVREKYVIAEDGDPLEMIKGLDTATAFYADMETKIMEKYKVLPNDPTKAAPAQAAGRPDMSTHEGMMKFITSLYKNEEHK